MNPESHPDDRSPVTARRRVRIGYPEDAHLDARKMIRVTTENGDQWLIESDRLTRFPLVGPSETWPLVVCDWLAVGCPFEAYVLLPDGREHRLDTFGEVQGLVWEVFESR